MKGSIRKRGNSYKLTVDIGKDAEGRRRQHSQTFRTRKEADAALGAILKQAQDGSLVKPTRLSTGQYLHQWLDGYAQSHVRPLTLRGYRGVVERHLVPVFGNVPLTSLQPSHVQEAHSRGLAAGLSPQSVGYLHRILSEALKHAEQWGMVGRNVARLVPPPRPTYKEARFLDAAEAMRLIEAAKSTPYYALLALALATGLRRGELLGLQWRDIDLEKGNLQVSRALLHIPGVGSQLHDVKSTRSRRQLALSPNAVLVLRAHRDDAEAVRAEAGAELESTALIFCHPTGHPLAPNGVSEAFQRIAKTAGISGATFHSLRHSHASLLLAQGANLKDIQTLLGHSSIAITGNLYAHVTEQRQREVVARLDQALDVAASIRVQSVSTMVEAGSLSQD